MSAEDSGNLPFPSVSLDQERVQHGMMERDKCAFLEERYTGGKTRKRPEKHRNVERIQVKTLAQGAKTVRSSMPFSTGSQYTCLEVKAPVSMPNEIVVEVEMVLALSAATQASLRKGRIVSSVSNSSTRVVSSLTPARLYKEETFMSI